MMAKIDLLRRFRVLALRYQEQGGWNAFLWLIRKVKSKITGSIFFQKSNVLQGLDFLSLKPVPTQKADLSVSKKSLNWFVPPFGRGSGGHLNIFRFIANLEALGFESNIIVVANTEPLDDEETLRSNICKWFGPIKAKVYKGLENAPPAHITLATEWRTAYYVRAFGETKHRCYFVQDFEPWFFPIGSEYYFAEETYRFGFVGITAGDWLKSKLAKEYGMTTHSVGFSCDQELYKPRKKTSESDREVKRVFFYARPPTPRRAFELGLLALREVSRRMPNVKIVLAGWDLSAFEIPFPHENLGILAIDSLPEIYGSCDVALVLSLTNLSLLPLELMSCGVPIVCNTGPNNEWLLNSSNSKLARLTPDEIANAVCEILNDTGESSRLIRSGFDVAHKTSWKKEAEKLGQILESQT